MYRCRLTYEEWKCIVAKKRKGIMVDTPEFSGYVGLLDILEVSEPQVWKYNGEALTVCDKGYQWLMV